MMAKGLGPVVDYLKAYDGPEIKIMEVCGTHTAAIFQHAIRSLISPKIRLISGPGCPVCVTPAAYVDRVGDYAEEAGHRVYSFGDMLKVPGTRGSLSERKGRGARVEVVYSPFEVLARAQAEPALTHVVAAVGFETTAPLYGLMAREMKEKGIENIRFVTALKTILPALHWICQREEDIDGFLCPGHVCVILGSKPFAPLAAKYRRPFVVAGFEAEHILVSIYDILRQVEEGRHEVRNHYKNAVREEGNPAALEVLEHCFLPGPAVWRGLGVMEDSGLYLGEEFAAYDGGSRGLDEDLELPEGCACREVITGRADPVDCPIFGEACSPTHPYGPCMVSAEGACGIWYRHR